MHEIRLRFLENRLIEGAPGVAFCLGAPLSTIEQALGPNADPSDAAVIAEELQAKDLELSAPACGLDGYAVRLFDPKFRYDIEPFYDHFLIERVTKYACELLGLVYDKKNEWGHPLFEVKKMPWEYTSLDAAKAVRRVISGEPPWLD